MELLNKHLFSHSKYLSRVNYIAKKFSVFFICMLPIQMLEIIEISVHIAVDEFLPGTSFRKFTYLTFFLCIETIMDFVWDAYLDVFLSNHLLGDGGRN